MDLRNTQAIRRCGREPQMEIRCNVAQSTTFRSPISKLAITMNFDAFDLAGFVGVLLIVIAYLLLQLDKLPSSSLSFSLLNAAGSLLIMLSLVFKFNVSAFLIEVFWFFDQPDRAIEVARCQEAAGGLWR
jgi:hypothetical protein